LQDRVDGESVSDVTAFSRLCDRRLAKPRYYLMSLLPLSTLRHIMLPLRSRTHFISC
jgi:hypothetical protein